MFLNEYDVKLNPACYKERTWEGLLHSVVESDLNPDLCVANGVSNYLRDLFSILLWLIGNNCCGTWRTRFHRSGSFYWRLATGKGRGKRSVQMGGAKFTVKEQEEFCRIQNLEIGGEGC